MKLYKYCPPERLDILQAARIALSRPRVFNDPFDLNPHLRRFANRVEMDMNIQERTGDFVILSLAENRDSLLMWAHYTQAYKGFVIGFDNRYQILKSESTHRDFGAMRYTHHRPSREKFKQVTNEELFYTKSSEWSYEKEWRIIDSLFSADGEALDGASENCWPFNLNPTAIREVIVGYRAGDVLKQIAQILWQPRYRHVRLYMALPDAERFSLAFTAFRRNQQSYRFSELVGN